MSDDPQAGFSTPRRRLRLSQIVGRLLLAGVAVLVMGLALLVLWARDTTEPLTESKLNEAIQLWRDNGPPSYDLDVKTIGSNNDRINIEVRRGEVTACTLNDHKQKDRRLWEYWTVPMQFGYIQGDLRMAEKPDQAGAILRAEFDPQYGYPRSYRRTWAGGGVSNGWRVTRFRAVAE